MIFQVGAGGVSYSKLRYHIDAAFRLLIPWAAETDKVPVAAC
jgi:hypothetical protein